MAVTFRQPRRTGSDAWVIAWTSDQVSPTYRVYRDGRLIATTTAQSITITVAAGSETPVIEVLDDAADLPAAGFPGRALLAWFRSATGSLNHFRVEEYVGAAWTLRRKLRDPGSTINAAGYFTWKSRWLEDVTTHQFRVIPVGDNGNQGSAMTFAVFVVRHPDPPSVTVAWDSGTAKVTITAA